MKRELIQNVKVQPYTSGDAIERNGFFSAIIGAKVTADGDLTIAVTHSDAADGTFEAVTDERVFPEQKTENGKLTVKDCKADDIVNIDIDLLGLKGFVKIAVTGASSLAVALGDSAVQPV